ncbi:MAG: STAS domain-containing protein [Armatimonadetes bacterium]|nr:STAS domain-containing protein [Armatimonadota bacterium]PIU67514.1 MAG: anti-sigma factor antagonist [Armatimonadetes bacterium CG07_land_8_20_14_0_80_59_28]PJB64269.1 MAG: anti-sigma factor antagonist [Armatimonadetes bacterium CG_4_9_14_3_um_filter_58_7]
MSEKNVVCRTTQAQIDHIRGTFQGGTMPDLSITSEVRNVEGKDIEVVQLEGFIDSHTFPEFESMLNASLERGARRFLLNMRGLNYINSTGLGLLMSVYRQVRQESGDLAVAQMSEKITNIFNLLGFSRIIKSFPGEEEAIRGLID